MKKALFLDRDGVINVDYGYVHKKDNFDFIDGIFDLVNAAKKLGYLTIIVTNQAGIGRGYYSENDFHELMSWVSEQFIINEGCIDDIYFCPYHPTHGIGVYLKDSSFRKPAPGMLKLAALEHNIDLSNSILVGDKETDIEAASAAGVEKRLLFSKDKSKQGINIDTLIDVINYL